MRIEDTYLARLRAQISRGEVILFTGAGFSLGAAGTSGEPLPSTGELKRELWGLCYASEAYDDNSSLGDLYAAALKRAKSELTALVHSRLCVDPASLPDYYRVIFEFPWLRCYTLNVDDLESAASRRFKFDRKIASISAREREINQLPGTAPSSRGLEVVHLNGMVPSAPESLTFSETQYAERIGSQEPWYARCVVDITSRPVVFIGTVLNESLALATHGASPAERKSRSRLAADIPSSDEGSATPKKRRSPRPPRELGPGYSAGIRRASLNKAN